MSAKIKVNVRLFKSDFVALRKFYPSVGYNRAIRTLVAKHVKKLEAKLEQKIDEEQALSEG